ncbi:MAG: tryptophan--tRNA ligase [Acidobacteriota bacterium]|nr:tryptophan--tRNA ligase [Acidobacteriota bacterium]
MKKQVFSGMRPTNRLHLGNYFGALVNWVRMQEEYRCIYGIVDYHALTSEYGNVGRINKSVLEVAIDWLVSGIDPERSIVMVQSLVPEHAELHLLLSMIVPVPWLERVPTYKEQIKQLEEKDLSTYGFLGYPLLQAADILIYKADVVPTGEDQVAHIELCREIARRFNHLYGNVFPEPESQLTQIARLPGTDGRKMSKSYGNEIPLSVDPEIASKKIMTMVTDPARKKRDDPGDPQKCPIFDYHKVFSSNEDQEWVRKGCTTAGIGCVDCKKHLLKGMSPVMGSLYEKRKELEKSPDSVKEILIEGSARAREIARETLGEVRQAMKIQY